MCGLPFSNEFVSWSNNPGQKIRNPRFSLLAACPERCTELVGELVEPLSKCAANKVSCSRSAVPEPFEGFASRCSLAMLVSLFLLLAVRLSLFASYGFSVLTGSPYSSTSRMPMVSS
ncbi:MAG: hypothetical protein IH591_12415 [Bacteroidales bacterium]|nr:hypothetical protein [Bacteroidales bacterium]